jgi:hypothetical protein
MDQNALLSGFDLTVQQGNQVCVHDDFYIATGQPIDELARALGRIRPMAFGYDPYRLYATFLCH